MSYKVFGLLCMMLPTVIGAQTSGRGLVFERDRPWPELVELARVSNRYLLVLVCEVQNRDCEWMDRNTLSIDSVGTFLQGAFVPVKATLDGTSSVDSAIAALLKPPVRRFPGHLVFTPSGTLVHRHDGALDANGFIMMSRSALDSTKQYYVQLRRYDTNPTARDYTLARSLAASSRAAGDSATAFRIAGEYFKSLSEPDRYKRQNILFISRYTETPNDPAFEMFRREATRVDSAVALRGFADLVADNVIGNMEIAPSVFPNGRAVDNEPAWDELRRRVEMKYGAAYAERTVGSARVSWNEQKKNWRESSRLAALMLKSHGPTLATGRVNNLAWEVFLHSQSKTELNIARTMMQVVVAGVDSSNAAFVDTYANLLYKLGDVTEAIKWEERAVALWPSAAWGLGRTLEKMKKGEPTWP